MTVRLDGSATALVSKAQVVRLLQRSGVEHIYVKVAVAEEGWDDVDVLWLPFGITHGKALAYARSAAAALGVVKKGGAVTMRYGVRFRDMAAMATLAGALGLQEVVTWGRFKVTGFQDGVGAEGVVVILDSVQWVVEEVVYVGEGHAIVASRVAPPASRLGLRRAGGDAVLLRVQAVNARARELARARGMEGRRADADGDEHGTVDEQAPAAPRAARIAAFRPGARGAAQRALADSLRPPGRTRLHESTGDTPEAQRRRTAQQAAADLAAAAAAAAARPEEAAAAAAAALREAAAAEEGRAAAEAAAAEASQLR